MKAKILACRLALTFLIVVGLLFPSSVPSVKAYSTEITYSSFSTGLAQNNGTYARFNVGDAYYYAFIVGDHIGVYDEDGALIRDIDLSSYSNNILCSIIGAKNSTHALVVIGNYGDRTIRVLIVNIATGAVSQLFSAAQAVYWCPYSVSPIFKYGADYYVLYSNHYWYGSDHSADTFLLKIFPTQSVVSLTKTGTYPIYAPLFTIASSEDNTVFYFLGRQATGYSNEKRFRLDKLNFTDSTLKQLGDGSFDYDWSNCTMMFSAYYHNITNTNFIYDVLVAMPRLDSAKGLRVGLIRFNNTFLDDNALQWEQFADAAAGKLYLRPFTMDGGANLYNEIIDDNNYYCVFTGHNQYINFFYFEVHGIETDTPYLDISDNNVYQYYDSSFINPYYVGSAQIGGFQPPEYSVGIYIDYTNHKFKANGGFAIHYYGIGGYTYTYEFYRDDLELSQSMSPVIVGKKYQLRTSWLYQSEPIVEGWIDVYWDNVWWKSMYMHHSICVIPIEYSTSAQPSGVLKIVLTDKDRGNYNETYYYNQLVLSATTTTTDPGGDGRPKDIKDFLPNFAWMIALLVCLAPGIFLGAKYGLFAGILGVAFGLGLTYVFPVINLPIALQAFIVVGMAFALFFGGHGWSAPKK